VEINAEDRELETYWITRHNNYNCTTGAINPDSSRRECFRQPQCLEQLTARIFRQTEKDATLNQLCKDKIKQKKEHDNEKKARTKRFLHPSIICMLKHESAASILEINTKLTKSCKKFLNATSQGHAEQELSHQFDMLNLMDICFAPSTIQYLYLGKFYYGNTSSPSNFTIFASFEQPPLSNVKQENYLTCHLVHENGQRQ
jgi:hypothetical protein